MKFKKKFGILLEGFKIWVKKPSLILSGLILWAILWGISLTGKFLAPNFQTTVVNIAWTVAVAFVSFVVGAYFLAGMIGAAKENKEKSKWQFFSTANKFWLKNFFVILFILLVSMVVWVIAVYGARYVGRAIGLDTAKAVIVFISVYFIGLVGVLIFFTFSSFLLVIKNLNIFRAVGESVKLVRRKYLATLSLSVLFFVLFFVLDWVKNFVGDILLFGLLLPYFVAVLTRFVETADLKKLEK
jgi:hypothetical protein